MRLHLLEKELTQIFLRVVEEKQNPRMVLFENLNNMTVEEVASAVYNNIVSGLVGIHNNPTISIDQLSDEVVATREAVIFE